MLTGNVGIVSELVADSETGLRKLLESLKTVKQPDTLAHLEKMSAILLQQYEFSQQLFRQRLRNWQVLADASQAWMTRRATEVARLTLNGPTVSQPQGPEATPAPTRSRLLHPHRPTRGSRVQPVASAPKQGRTTRTTRKKRSNKKRKRRKSPPTASDEDDEENSDEESDELFPLRSAESPQSLLKVRHLRKINEKNNRWSETMRANKHRPQLSWKTPL